jgi:hypothetical protein
VSDKKPSRIVKYWECVRLPLGLAVLAGAIAVWRDLRSGGVALANAGLSLGPLLGLYVFAALTIGLVVLMWGHWATTRLRGSFLGFVSAAGLLCLFNFTISPFRASGGMLVFVLFLFGLFPGAMLGAMHWKPPE